MTETDVKVQEAIRYIHHNIYESFSLSELSSHVGYSPYHFSRLFKEKIGLPPLYYVSSLRLQKAKELLLQTNFTVRDIALETGQQSLGTFTTRFTKRVGMTPTHFRRANEETETVVQALQQLTNWQEEIRFSKRKKSLSGTIRSDITFKGVILVGLFSKPIPEGPPVYGTLLSTLGEFCFYDVKPGIYYLMATSISWEMNVNQILLPHTTLRTRIKKALLLGTDKEVPHQEVKLYPPRLDDPPILVSLPLLMNTFLKRMVGNSGL